MLRSAPVPSVSKWLSNSSLPLKANFNRGTRKEISSATTEQIPPDAWSKINAHLARESYRFDADEDGRFYASHREQNLRFIFNADGLTVTPRLADADVGALHLKLTQIGRDNTLMDVGSAEIVAERYRMEYRYADSGITEWYTNDLKGLEQGFTLNRPPLGNGLVRLTVTSNFAPHLAANGEIADWRINCATYRYSDIKVFDATGRTLPAHLELVEEMQGLQIVVNDQGATYPITIDPLITSQTMQLGAVDGAADDYFGSAVAVSGDIIVIGAPEDDIGARAQQGSAYVFTRNQGGADTWGQVKQLTSPFAQLFGISVAVSGDTLVAGVGSSSCAFVFHRNQGGQDNWGQVKQLVASDNSGGGDRFGRAVSISGDLIVIGAYQDDVGINNNLDQGSAYVFARNQGGPDNWGQIKQLTASDGAAGDYFGSSVAISGDSIVVGAYNHKVGSNPTQGSVYVFARNKGGANNWGEAKQLTAGEKGVVGARFGMSIAISANIVVVGGLYDKVGSNAGQGSAYVFSRHNGGIDNWGLVKQLSANNGAANDHFGSSVSVSDDTIVIGAPDDDSTNNVNQGSAYIFSRNQGGEDNWGQVEQLIIPDGATNDNFGRTVAISGNMIVIGAPLHKVGANTNQGVAYIFTRSGNDWAQAAHPIAIGGMDNDIFGVSVAISGDVVVIGAPLDDVGSNIGQGSAYVFTRNRGGANNWGQMKHLTAGRLANFGGSVAISDDTIVIGSTQGERVYIFSRNQGGADNWGQVKELIGNIYEPGSGFSSRFAFSVAISGNLIVIGADGEDIGTNVDQGAAYVYARNQGGADNWGQVKQLVASDGATEDRFGITVAISGDVIAVGASSKDIGLNEHQGSVYIFTRNLGGADNWGLVTQLLAADETTWLLGYNLAISGDIIAVGARKRVVGGVAEPRLVYVFTRNQGGVDKWGQIKQIVTGDLQLVDEISLSLSSDVIVIGVAGKTIGMNSIQGSSYVYARNQGGADNWGLVKQLTASDGSALDLFGSSVAVNRDLIVIGARGADVGGSAYIFTRNQGGADNWGQVKQLTPSGGAPDDRFGHSVAVSGDVVVIGAPNDDIGSNANQGSVYVFSRNQNSADVWGPVQQLTANDSAAGDQFGLSVAINGNLIVVGAYKDNNQGSAYVFSRTRMDQYGLQPEWAQIKKLTAADGMTEDEFGYSVAIDGDIIVVGARLDNIGTRTDQGSAYIFTRNGGGADNWGQVKQLTASDGATSDYFGTAVSVNGDVIVIGAIGSNLDKPYSQGSAYVFMRNTGGADNWGQVKQLAANDSAELDRFGVSVAICGDTIVVGAEMDDVEGKIDQGSAYVFIRNHGGADNWGQLRKLTSMDGSAGDNFGHSVVLSGDVIVVGAYADDIGTKSNQGSVYIFARNQGGADNWGQIKQLVASDGAANDQFGFSVAISGNVIAVGARVDNVGINADEGSAYIFVLT